jgi:EAL domain-containing protein (putative c-di-GMP-specific phosphodiesterase class I)
MAGGAEIFPQLDGPERQSNGSGDAIRSEDTPMREHVLDIISSILADDDPRNRSGRDRLRRLLDARPDNPEGALLEHLLETRKNTAQESRTAAREEATSLHFDSPDTDQTVAVPVHHEIREHIQAILAAKLLLTAFQPVHSLPDKNVVGVEALTRFVGEDGAGADVWFTEAAEAGFGTELEIAALHCALTAAKAIPHGMYLALNLTPATSRDSRVRTLLASATLPPNRIIVELTGSLQAAEGHDGQEGLGPLRAAGLRLAVSASGAAFTSFYRIAELRPDIIKLDRHLIKGIDHNEGQRVRARAAIWLARQLDATVVAEGIETTGELNVVIGLEVTAAQGYLFGRPSTHPLDWSEWRIRSQPEAQPAL